MRRRHVYINFVIVCTLLLPNMLLAQDANTISSATLMLFPQPNFYLNVFFANDLASPDADLVAANVQVTSTPPIIITTVGPLAGLASGVRITFTGTPPPEITNAQVCFSSVTFVESDNSTKKVSHVCSSIEVISRSNLAIVKAQMLKELTAVPKTTAEKNIFASGFVVTSSSGTEGGLDLNLNSNDLGIKGMNVSLQTMKTSVAGGDPKNFQVSLNFDNAYVFGGTELDAIRNAKTGQAINEAEKKIQSQVLGALLVKFSGTLEGEATNFNVANYVGDGEIALQSRTMTLFGSRKGFWQFRVVPFGIEGGKNVQNFLTTTGTSGSTMPGTPQNEDYVARYKGGATFSLFYNDPKSLLPFKRVEMDLGTAQRYLFFKEPEVLSANSTPVLQDGYRPWYQADLLVYVAESSSGRYGIRLSYNNGSLPPSFTVAKSFQFGFVFETSDDKKGTK